MNHAPYDSTVGGAFSRLGEGVRRAHSSPLVAEGDLRVEWSRSRLARLVARGMRLPPEGASVRTWLEVSSSPEGLLWVRDFGNHRVTTRQWASQGLLIESFGLARTCFRLVAEGDGLRYEPVGVWIGRWRVPFAPRIEATVSEADGGWHVDVRVDHPWLGRLCRYSGLMRAMTLE
ncbi:MAG: DUF4166 domain-containing protein [Fimbriimonas sp.]